MTHFVPHAYGTWKALQYRDGRQQIGVTYVESGPETRMKTGTLTSIHGRTNDFTRRFSDEDILHTDTEASGTTRGINEAADDSLSRLSRTEELPEYVKVGVTFNDGECSYVIIRTYRKLETSGGTF